MPEIGSEKLATIDTSKGNSWKIEAETFDMATPGVKKADGAADFVKADESVSGGKYLGNFGVAGNYFGFRFDSVETYTDATVILRVAQAGDTPVNLYETLGVYLNYEGVNKKNALANPTGPKIRQRAATENEKRNPRARKRTGIPATPRAVTPRTAVPSRKRPCSHTMGQSSAWTSPAWAAVR